MASQTNGKRQVTRGTGKILDRYGFFVILMLFLLLVTIVGLIFITQKRIWRAESQIGTYTRHYMFVSRTGNTYVSDRIFEKAREYGQIHGVYVEQLENFLDANYEDADYLKMAMSMQVDGIILEGSEEDEVRHCINQASELGIPVVTIRSDCPGSRRRSFIELGDYDLGREYGRLIIDIAHTREPKVVLLTEKNADISRIQTGIEETLKNEGNHLQVQFETKVVNPVTGSRRSNRIRAILTGEDRPDILICMNESDTQRVYQSVIDYDLEDEVQIIGTCISEFLLRAVQEGTVAALIDVDTAQVGTYCIDALNYYIENRSVNDHIIVDDVVITKENVERYLNDE
ncbi:MAG: substrate-binding domain-containing protein [Lachnospiraceae bacterium]|nr:substrate-binding domain-containing protein [Lachnospiraceae bacterium]